MKKKIIEKIFIFKIHRTDIKQDQIKRFLKIETNEYDNIIEEVLAIRSQIVEELLILEKKHLIKIDIENNI